MATRGKQAPPAKNPTELEISYLAGLMDADGCIAMSKMIAGPQKTKNHRYAATMNIVNTSPDLMKWLVEKFGGIYRQRRRMSEKHKPTFDWYFNNGKALWILKLIEPFLVVKKERARVVIEFLENRVLPSGFFKRIPDEEAKRREALYQRMKSLNQFGPVQPQRLNSLAPQSQEGDAIV